MTRLRRPLSLLLAAVLVVLGMVGSPLQAQACACGAVQSDTYVTGEVVLVQWDGRHQATDMQMLLDAGTKDAGWIMPTPRGTTMTLGGTATFQQLAQATAPRDVARKRYHLGFGRGGDAAGRAPGTGAPPVSIEGTHDVGPFRVTTLSGEATSVNTWLVDNGYPGRDDLVPAFRSYLDQGWVLQAVKLVPEKLDAEFRHSLPPLRMTFDTTSPVYPIRLSAQAAHAQNVRLYLLSDQPMKVSRQAAPDQPLDLIYSGPVDLMGIPDPLVRADKAHLTAFERSLTPDRITGDFEFAPDPGAADYQRTRIYHEDVYLGPAILAGLVGLALVAGVVVLIVRRRRRPRGTTPLAAA